MSDLSDRWDEGPNFLSEFKCDWQMPSGGLPSNLQSDPEVTPPVKVSTCGHMTGNNLEHPLDISLGTTPVFTVSRRRGVMTRR